MFSKCIDLYENEKNYQTKELATLFAFRKLREDLEDWAKNNKWQSHTSRGRLFFDDEVTKNNLQIINQILPLLENPWITSEDIANILGTHVAKLFKKGELFDLTKHVLKDHKESYTNTRPSSVLNDEPPQSFEQLFSKKNINPTSFSRSISLQQNISDHAAWVYSHIYSVDYVGSHPENGIARPTHGIAHASRATAYVLPIVNLYRRYNDAAALSLAEEDVKLLQIAVLFHDTAREDDKVDKWDRESGEMLYYYLTEILRVDKSKAILLAEAVANKDLSDDGYFKLTEENGQMHWQIVEWQPDNKRQKNIFQKIIHDADCLDIKRARAAFDGEFLDFYKQTAKHNTTARKELAHFISDIRSLTDIEGDSFQRMNYQVKKQYENEDCYKKVVKDIHSSDLSILPILYNEGRMISSDELHKPILAQPAFDPARGVDNQASTLAAINAGNVLVRGILCPSGISKKPRTVEDKNIYESFAATELRKMSRRLGIPTSSSKSDADKKVGNPHRSLSMIGYAGGVFSSAGFMIVNPDKSQLTEVRLIDFSSGFGKKAHWRNTQTISDAEKEKRLDDMHTRLMMGGTSTTFQKTIATHVELIYNVTSYDAIYYSQDPTLGNFLTQGVSDPMHKYSPLLQAVFLRNEYLKTENRELPIYEYSAVHNQRSRLVPPEEYTDEKLKSMWVEMCSAYIKKQLENPFSNAKIFSASIDDIKILSMYNKSSNFLTNRTTPADSNYSTSLRNEINQEISKIYDQLILEEQMKISQTLIQDPKLLITDEYFSVIMNSPNIINSLKDKIDQTSIISMIEHEMEQLEKYFMHHKLDDTTKMERLYYLTKSLGLSVEQEKIEKMMSKFVANLLENTCDVPIAPAPRFKFNKQRSGEGTNLPPDTQRHSDEGPPLVAPKPMRPSIFPSPFLDSPISRSPSPLSDLFFNNNNNNNIDSRSPSPNEGAISDDSIFNDAFKGQGVFADDNSMFGGSRSVSPDNNVNPFAEFFEDSENRSTSPLSFLEESTWGLPFPIQEEPTQESNKPTNINVSSLKQALNLLNNFTLAIDIKSEVNKILDLAIAYFPPANNSTKYAQFFDLMDLLENIAIDDDKIKPLQTIATELAFKCTHIDLQDDLLRYLKTSKKLQMSETSIKEFITFRLSIRNEPLSLSFLDHDKIIHSIGKLGLMADPKFTDFIIENIDARTSGNIFPLNLDYYLQTIELIQSYLPHGFNGEQTKKIDTVINAFIQAINTNTCVTGEDKFDQLMRTISLCLNSNIPIKIPEEVIDHVLKLHAILPKASSRDDHIKALAMEIDHKDLSRRAQDLEQNNINQIKLQ